MQIRNFSFGATAAVVTSMGLIIGLDAATATRATILSGLLIGLSYAVARTRKLPVLREIGKHVAVAAVVMISSMMIGHIILA